ncbi:MAG TPA: hypothetical protein VM597_19780 [Gemmataceae bacterium]|nr:hypothetical protein [Gemmataceae bacterium]
MSDDLRRRLRLLEDEYPAQPVVAQQADLREINRLRAELGMPAVDARLREVGTAAPVAEPAAPPPKAVRDHSAARAIYQAYRKKVEELAVHQAYAEQVAAATAGHGRTPVRPLATMGTGGGPLRCDLCGKPIVLEGGASHGVAADAAWARDPRDGWESWILGGLVVEIQTNGTLRIYHGYPAGGARQCCQRASKAHREARAAFVSRMPPGTPALLLAFLTDEFPDRTGREHRALADTIIDVMYSYDPGLGVNRPTPT